VGAVGGKLEEGRAARRHPQGRLCRCAGRFASIRTASRTGLLLWWVAKRSDGKFQTEIVQRIFKDHADGHAADCALK
jgi:hypothetical protein